RESAAAPRRVVHAKLWGLETARLLTLRLDLGPRRQGRLLLGPGMVLVDGEDHGFRGRWSGLGRARYETIDVPLPAETPDVVSITFRLPRVEILGPWIVPLGFWLRLLRHLLEGAAAVLQSATSYAVSESGAGAIRPARICASCRCSSAVRPSPRALAMKRSSTAQQRLRQLVSQGKRPITF